MWQVSASQANTWLYTCISAPNGDFDIIDADIEVFSERFLCLRNRLGHHYWPLSCQFIIFSGQRLKPQRSDFDPQFGGRRVGHRVTPLLPDALYIDERI